MGTVHFIQLLMKVFCMFSVQLFFVERYRYQPHHSKHYRGDGKQAVYKKWWTAFPPAKPPKPHRPNQLYQTPNWVKTDEA